MCFGHYSPKYFYDNIFALSSRYGYSILDIERMYPFELVMMIDWLNHEEKEKEKERQRHSDTLKIIR